MRNKRRGVAAGIAALAMFGAGCGGDNTSPGSSDPEAATIESTVTEALTSTDGHGCRELTTQAGVEQVTGQTGQDAFDACAQAEQAPTDEEKTVDVANVEVDGDAATADVTFHGSSLNGQTAIQSLVKEGDQWKLDVLPGFRDFDGDAFRDAYVGLFESQDADAGQRACLADALAGFSDDDLAQFNLNQGEILEDIQGGINDCLS